MNIQQLAAYFTGLLTAGYGDTDVIIHSDNEGVIICYDISFDKIQLDKSSNVLTINCEKDNETYNSSED